MAILRLLSRIAVLFLVITPLVARAQGLLIVENTSEQIRLPRPIIIWPPHPPHPPQPPAPPPIRSSRSPVMPSATG